MSVSYNNTPIQEHKNFIRETGITDSQGRKDLYTFIKHLKDNNMWDNICCLPMRSGQNNSDTTNLKSFGGLATLSPSIVGDVTFGENGAVIATDAANYMKLANSITLPLHPCLMYITQTEYEVWDGVESAGAYTNRCYFWNDDTGGAASSLWINSNWYRQARFYGGIPTNGASGGFYTTQSGYHSDETWRSLGLQRLSNYTQLKPKYIINGADATGPFGGSSSYSLVDPPNSVTNPRVVQSGTYAMIIIANNIDLTTLLSVYKDTLGRGLGLP